MVLPLEELIETWMSENVKIAFPFTLTCKQSLKMLLDPCRKNSVQSIKRHFQIFSALAKKQNLCYLK